MRHLQLEIKRHHDVSSPQAPIGTVPRSEGYHAPVRGLNGVIVPSVHTYLGQGCTARLIEHLLDFLTRCHLRQGLELPAALQDDAPDLGPANALPKYSPASTVLSVNRQRKTELSSLLPPATQRAVIEHYVCVVSPQYAIFSPEHEHSLLAHEKPLKWSPSDENDSSACMLICIFAVSTALISRDLDPDMAEVSAQCRQEVYRISRGLSTHADAVEDARRICTACAVSAMCELVRPLSDQVWELSGMALLALERLRDTYQIRNLPIDLPFKRLERSILKLERYEYYSLLLCSHTC